MSIEKLFLVQIAIYTLQIANYLLTLQLSSEMEAFFRTHAYLVEHTNAPVRRMLMDEIDWNDRMIGIKGTRGIGKTTFLLQYAKENFDVNDRRCLYIKYRSG